MADIEELRTWVGNARVVVDIITAKWCDLMYQTLDSETVPSLGDPLPPLWHWIYFLESVPLSQLGRDGHPQRGGFLPPVDLPRRMWAGSRVGFASPILIGDTVTKTSTISAVAMKEGSSGPLCFVTVNHELSVDGRLCLSEEQDLVYRQDPDPNAPKPEPKPAPTIADWSVIIKPSPVQLFRYSALTFNGHRIHYDRTYAGEVEGYPGLVVHGPLTATLLADLAASSEDQPLSRFEFRALSPLFDSEPFSINGKANGSNISLWATTPGGGLAMTAEAGFLI